MFINLMQALYLDEEEFAQAVAERESMLDAGDLVGDIGCITCGSDGGSDVAGGGN